MTFSNEDIQSKKICGCSTVVVCVLAKHETRVRFPLPAPNKNHSLRMVFVWSIYTTALELALSKIPDQWKQPRRLLVQSRAKQALRIIRNIRMYSCIRITACPYSASNRNASSTDTASVEEGAGASPSLRNTFFTTDAGSARVLSGETSSV